MLRPTVSRSICLDVKPLLGSRPDFCYCLTVAGLLIWGALSDDRTDLSFTTAAGPRQRSHSRFQIPRDSWPYFTVSDSRLLQTRVSGSRIYITQEQGGPVIPLRTGFLFIASYDSEGYGGSIRNRLHAELLLNNSSQIHFKKCRFTVN
jgi:hypothetical protein